MNIDNDKINRAIKILTAALLIFIPILFNPIGFDVFALPRVFFLYFIVTILAFLAVLDIWQKPRVGIIYNKLLVLILLFWFLVIFSVFFAQDKHTAFWGYPWDYEGLFAWLAYFIVFSN